MAWSGKSETVACNLWASMWSQCLIGAALGFSADQVEAKFGRMRIQKDARIEHADLVRCISKVAGGRILVIEDMQPFLSNEKFRAGLMRALRESAGIGPAPKQGEDEDDDHRESQRERKL